MGHLFSILWILILLPVHGDVHQRILAVSASIESHPDSLLLYQIRGELYLLHEEPASAYADFQFCRSRQFNAARVYFGLSRCVELAADSALYFVNQALLSEPDMQGALEWKARLLLLLQNPCEAAAVYDQLLHTSADPSPALFIDASAAWNACSGQLSDPRAIRVLNDGLLRLGNILVLQKELVNQYLQKGDFPRALALQNQMVEQASQKTKPLMSRAAIHVSMGKKQLAQDDLQLALHTLDGLPTHRSGTPAMKALRENILSLLKDVRQ